MAYFELTGIADDYGANTTRIFNLQKYEISEIINDSGSMFLELSLADSNNRFTFDIFRDDRESDLENSKCFILNALRDAMLKDSIFIISIESSRNYLYIESLSDRKQYIGVLKFKTDHGYYMPIN